IFRKEAMRFIQLAEQNNILIYTINTEIDHPGISSYVGQHSFDAGRLAAKMFHLANPSLREITIVNLGQESHIAKHVEDKINGFSSFFRDMGVEVVLKEQHFSEFTDKVILNREVKKRFAGQDKIKAIWFVNSRAYTFLSEAADILAPECIVLGYDLI